MYAVFTREETRAVLRQMELEGAKWLMASLLYGAGLRLVECLRLRVKDLDFGYGHIMVRSGKGNKDRVTLLPQALKEPSQRHLERVKASSPISDESCLRHPAIPSVWPAFAVSLAYSARAL